MKHVGSGVVWELAFGSWVLLQPERINAYSQAVKTSNSRCEEARTGPVFPRRFEPRYLGYYRQTLIRTLQADEHQRGCLMEERISKGDLAYGPEKHWNRLIREPRETQNA